MRTILCIPGPWADKAEFAGLAGKFAVRVEFTPSDDRMRSSFEYCLAEQDTPAEFLEEIENHSTVVYLSCKTGNRPALIELSRAGEHFLANGGIGIKIETTGKAFTREQWTRLLNSADGPELYEMFVFESLTDQDACGEANVFSCGMHNLGLRDVICSGPDVAESLSAVCHFCYYLYLDNPVISANETFEGGDHSHVYRITEEADQPFQDDELFGNPFGMWRLARIGRR